MDITLNIGLEVSKHYLPEGVAGMHLHYKYVEGIVKQTFGKPICIGLTQSSTEKTLVVQYTNVHDVLQKLSWLARELQQDYIAYRIKDGGKIVGGALIGEYAHEWNYGIFDEEYFIEDTWHMKFHVGWPL